MTARAFFSQFAQEGRARLTRAHPTHARGMPAGVHDGWGTWLIDVRGQLLLCTCEEPPVLAFVPDDAEMLPHWCRRGWQVDRTRLEIKEAS